MSGLVIELQRSALDSNRRVSDLLRMALVVSKKLGVIDIEEWIRLELDGYHVGADEVPDYRVSRGSPKVWNPYHGWQPLNCESAKTAKLLSERGCIQSIAELERLLASDSNSLHMEYPPDITNRLMRSMDVALQPALLVPHTEILRIVDTVRNRLLNWSLELEAQNITGEDMSFSDTEKEAAKAVNYHITNNIGSMNNSQLQQDSPNANQVLNVQQHYKSIHNFIDDLRGQSSKLPLNTDDKRELEAEISTIENQLSSPKPKQVIVTESLKSVRAILEGIAGSVIASGLLSQLGMFL